MENQNGKNDKRKLTVIIVSVIIVYIILMLLFIGMIAAVVVFEIKNESPNYERGYSTYKIEVGATKNNFSGKYIDLFETMDKNSDGMLSHSEVIDFYTNTVVTKENHPDMFLKEDDKWTVSEGLKRAALEYYTKGEITTPELKKRYDGYFYGINSGVEKK